MASRGRDYVRGPEDILYNQIERVLRARFEGKGAKETLFSLADSIPDRLRTPELEKELAAVRDAPDSSFDHHFSGYYHALINLLDEKGFWLPKIRKPARGEEMLESI